MINEEPEPLHFNGSWENKNRSITAAAIAGLVGIGAIFFNVQSILIIVFALLYRFIYHILIPHNYLDKLNAISTYLKTPILISLVISEFIFMLVPTIWIVKKWHTTDIRKYIRIKLCPIKEIILAVLITLLFLPFCYYISYLLIKYLEIPESLIRLNNQLFTSGSTGQFFVMIFVVGITPAICEEIFFRGYVQRTLERTLGMKSFIITGIIFGLFHMRPLSLITLSILGILLSFFYYRSKSILPSSAAHFTNNFIAIFLLYAQSKLINIGIPADGNFSLLTIIISLFFAALLLQVYWRITNVNFADKINNQI